MHYLTDRKRAEGLGSGKTGTEHFWHMQISSVALLFLVPLFLFTVGPLIGESHATVVAAFARPWPAISTGLLLIVGMIHFKNGAQVAIEDYAGGLTRKLLIIGVICLSYGIIATGIFALVRLAL
jgi:succinate dehydrogenase / fumarate reductase membrane anchor subunit